MSDFERPIIKNREVKVKDKTYIIEEIAHTKESLMHIGKFFAETKKEEDMFFGDYGMGYDGVYIYQDRTNPNVGYRIYQEFAEYKFDGYSDDKLIALLNEKQPLIKKSRFPKRIITLNGNIIGQEIPLYLNHSEIHQYCKENQQYIPTKGYKQILDILTEMYDKKIGYLDGHSKNFVVEKNSGHVEIIDFEWDKMSFDNILESDNWKIFNNLNALINRCNENSRINDIVKPSNVQNFSEAYEYVEEAEHKLIKSGRYCK